MEMKDEELRQLRAWAVETVLSKHSLESGDPVSRQGVISHTKSIDVVKVIAEARKLVNFVRANP